MFYVYEHWRPDLDIPFYVGKGSGDRYNPARTRNTHHTRIKKKLKILGMCVEVRMVASGLTEDVALSLEIERIAFWRNNGVELSNKTSGGEGLKSPTEEVLQKMRDSSKKRWDNHENRKKHSILTKNGMDNEIVKEKISYWKGKTMSETTKQKMSISAKKNVKTPEHIAKIAAKQIGNKRGIGNKSHLGQKMSEETRAKMRESQKQRRLHEKELA
jgi:hypothetical protein